MVLQFDNISLTVQADEKHEWVLSTAEVAAGFGVSPDAIRMHKSRNTDELIEGKHFTSVTNSYAVRNQADTFWTKKGVVRLGFFIKSERAKRFRDWAEDLIINRLEEAYTELRVPKSLPEALRLYALEKEAREEAQRQLEEAKPKVNFYEAVTGSKDAMDLSEVAKTLNWPNMGRNKLFEFLRNHGVLRDNNQPYQSYVDNGWMRLIESKFQKPNGDIHINLKTVVFQTGLQGIRKLLVKHIGPNRNEQR